MNRLRLARLSRLLATAFAICFAALAAGADTTQNPPPPGGKPEAAAQSGKPDSDKQWLARTSKLYYSSAKAGLTGFDCAVHPDWYALFVTANKGETAAADDPRIVLLKAVKVTLHARMEGGSTIDWIPDSSSGKPLDDSSTALLDGMRKTVEQTLEGFLQFWSPFMEGTVVPDSADGLEISHTPATHTIHAKQAGTELTEVFSSDLVLRQFNVDMSGVSIKFSPAYKPTQQGLLVDGFEAHILPAGTSPEQAQVMKIAIDYQTANGLTIPAQLNMDVIGTGTFKFAFDGCTTNPK